MKTAQVAATAMFIWKSKLMITMEASPKCTQMLFKTMNPVWNEVIKFEVNEWSWFTVQAWDEDTTDDEKLSDAHTFTLQSFVNVKKQEMKAFGEGTIIFDYSFQP